MSYSLDRFIKPLIETDKIVNIYNNLNKPTYTINPVSVSRVYASGNLLKINLTKNNTVIILDFSDNSEAKQALLRLQSQFNLIKNRLMSEDKAKEIAISQVQDSLDLSSLYQSVVTGGTFSGPTYSGGSGTASGTASGVSSNTIEQRLFSFVQKIGNDVATINSKNIKKIISSYSPIDNFEEDLNSHNDVIGVEFDFDSQGNVNIYINSVLLLPGEELDSIAYFGKDNDLKSNIFKGSRLYINPSLLGYSLETSDVISIEYLRY